MGMNKKSAVLSLFYLLFLAMPAQASLVIWVNNGQDKVTYDDLRAHTSALTDPGGFTISRRTIDQGDLIDGLFSYIDRNIELFYIKQMQIKKLSILAYDGMSIKDMTAQINKPAANTIIMIRMYGKPHDYN